MSYQVLARKLRPATFEALVGQEHVVRALRHALDHDRLHHAYLFTGTRGVGKTTIARVLAKSLNCERGVSSNPCGDCSVCREVAENRFIDLIEVDAASRTRVDDTRELLENAQYLPTRGRYKVYLIDEVHMLSSASFNALLKTLEEPPAHVVFLLATTDPKKVPVTVLSRCLQFQLKNLTAERIADYLANALAAEGVPAEPAALETIGAAARGSMRDALSITDQAIAFGQGAIRAADLVDMLGLVGRDAIGGLLDALAAEDASRLLALSGELAERSTDFDDVLSELIAALHGIAVAQALREPHPHAEAFAPEMVQLLYQIALLGHRDLAIAPDPRVGFEMTLLRMLAFAPEAEDEPPRDSAPGRGAAPRRAGPLSSSLPVSGGPSGSATRLAAVPTLASTPAPMPARSTVAVAAPAIRAVVDRSPAASPSPELTGDQEHWHQLLASLELSGMARLLADNTECLAQEAGGYRLRLEERHDALLADGPVASLERALATRLGREIRVRIELGPVKSETPAARRVRLRAEGERVARDLLAQDPGVQSLLSTFAGRLEEVRLLKD
ncbi:MAG: DNA polymerase III subunit gamma/tau [Pseudomonadales bacterium]